MSISDLAYLPEDASHDAAIQIINEEAFGPGRFARAAERIREQGPYEQALSYVCASGGEIIASVRMTPILAGPVPAYLLGPLAVRPSHKNLGIGRELVRIAVAAAEQAGAKAVILIGDPPYYGPLGFSVIRPGALQMPGPVDPRRVLAACLNGAEAPALEGEIRHRQRG
ncbi:GNAT family N-acetyltransferase [Pseudohoeflea coraliihabitans]|uniref:N-acetyltransferase n=1 Tax=Pseudohoeflea coraliihabitans TaxID=2860393 RepID=A0ABS6WJU2_9HYPH|nr:N-acetyltransferase [Pseudohoeflea sp. DP4N28-3]MBW3096130.1 N-acetyltransferase [Pseudohoeflea sp. DP4N28-3]